jgi:hypothetical protein
LSADLVFFRSGTLAEPDEPRVYHASPFHPPRS